MNFVFISPQFPHTYWNFCDRLKKNGVNVLGIGDAPYDSLDWNVKNSLTEYYYVQSLEDYDQVFRAVAFFSFKYGKIDWLESNNEYWLEQDAKLRTDFHITSGIGAEDIQKYKSKADMKAYYAAAGVPTARQHKVSTKEAAEEFLQTVGYPVIVKPEVGVGANDTHKLKGPEDLDAFYANLPSVPYVMEEFVHDGMAGAGHGCRGGSGGPELLYGGRASRGTSEGRPGHGEGLRREEPLRAPGVLPAAGDQKGTGQKGRFRGP